MLKIMRETVLLWILIMFLLITFAEAGWKVISGIGKSCPKATRELFRNAKEGESESKEAPPLPYKRLAYKCRYTRCQLPTLDLCSELEDRFVLKGKLKLVYEEVYREPCTLAQGPGVVGVCCAQNSLGRKLSLNMGAGPNEFPHMARLLTPWIYCGGTIYNSKYIITAAHCLFNYAIGEAHPPSEAKIVLGSNLLFLDTTLTKSVQGSSFQGENSNENVYTAKRFILHPKFGTLMTRKSGSIANYDIALIELEDEIRFGPNVKALRIAPKGFDPLEYSDKALIAGWGHHPATLDEYLAELLHKSNVWIRTERYCYGESEELVTDAEMAIYMDQLICLGGFFRGKWGPIGSGGDSGRPAVCRSPDGGAVLCGVSSTGPPPELAVGCDLFNRQGSCTPGEYSNVGYFHDWIRKVAGKQNPANLIRAHLYGERVKPAQYKHQVHIVGDNGVGCGGTLIAPNVVLTTARCVGKSRGVEKTIPEIKVTGWRGQSLGSKDIRLLSEFNMDGFPLNISEPEGRGFLSLDNIFPNELAIITLEESVPLIKNFPMLPKTGDYQPDVGLEIALTTSVSSSGGFEMRQQEFHFLPKVESDRWFGSQAYPDILYGVETYSGGSSCDRELGGGIICRGDEGQDILCGVQVFRLCEYSVPNLFLNVAYHSAKLRNVMERAQGVRSESVWSEGIDSQVFNLKLNSD